MTTSEETELLSKQIDKRLSTTKIVDADSSHDIISSEHAAIIDLCAKLRQQRICNVSVHIRCSLAITLCYHRLLRFSPDAEEALQSQRKLLTKNLDTPELYDLPCTSTNNNQEKNHCDSTTKTNIGSNEDDCNSSNGLSSNSLLQSCNSIHEIHFTLILVTEPLIWYPYLLLLRILLRDQSVLNHVLVKFPSFCSRLAVWVGHFCTAVLWDQRNNEASIMYSASNPSSFSAGSSYHPHEYVCIELTAIVHRISKVPECAQVLVSKENIEKSLVPLLVHPNSDVMAGVAHALQALMLAAGVNEDADHQYGIKSDGNNIIYDGDTEAENMCTILARTSIVPLALEALGAVAGQLRLVLLRILATLASNKVGRHTMIIFDALQQLTVTLQETDIDIRLLSVTCVAKLSKDYEEEVRISGLIPHLAKILASYVDGNGKEDSTIPVSSSTMTFLPKQLNVASPNKHSSLRCAIMSALMALCWQEVGAVQVQEANVIYLASRILVRPLIDDYRQGKLPLTSSPSRPGTPANGSQLSYSFKHRHQHQHQQQNQHQPKADPSIVSRAYAALFPDSNMLANSRRSSRTFKPPAQTQIEQACALRLLRFLFSAERNRRYFKRLFPPDLFSRFIDIGHYRSDLNVYIRLARALHFLTPAAFQRLQNAVEETNISKQPRRHVANYGLLEKLGEGSFGCVYRAVRSGSDQMYAIKEIPVRHAVGFGATDGEQKKTIQRIENEVKIMQGGLRHPNVVRYEASFVWEHALYIVMEMVEGASLLDHLSSLVEKRQTIDEGRIWRIFVQICNGLRYMHLEKKVVHRDLSPSNVMLGWYDKVTIVDFGLARQRNTGNTLMESSVGTLLYSCPEIVTNKKYNEKADIWALGCLLYQMATLQPPFATSNILALAKRIVEGRYNPIPSTCSDMLRETISVCLTPNPALRPDISEVCQAIGPAIMCEFDALTRTVAMKDKVIARERALKWHHRRDAQNAQATVQRLMHVSQHNRQVFDEQDIHDSQLPQCPTPLQDCQVQHVQDHEHGHQHTHGTFKLDACDCNQSFMLNRESKLCLEKTDAPEQTEKLSPSNEMWEADGDVFTCLPTRTISKSMINRQRAWEGDTHFKNSTLDEQKLKTVKRPACLPTLQSSRMPIVSTQEDNQQFLSTQSPTDNTSSQCGNLSTKPESQSDAMGTDQQGKTKSHVHSHFTAEKPFGMSEENLHTSVDISCSPQKKGSPLPDLLSSSVLATEATVATKHNEKKKNLRSRHVSAPLSTQPPSGRRLKMRPSSGSTGTATIRLPLSKLRPISDPIVLLLTQLKKVMYACRYGYDAQANPARHVIFQFQQALFRNTTSSSMMKEHLRKLHQALPVTIVDIDFGMAAPYAWELVCQRGGFFHYDAAHVNSTKDCNALSDKPHNDNQSGPDRTGDVIQGYIQSSPLNSIMENRKDAKESSNKNESAIVTTPVNQIELIGDGLKLPTLSYAENPTERLTADAFVFRNTLTYQQLREILEVELQSTGYYGSCTLSSSQVSSNDNYVPSVFPDHTTSKAGHIKVMAPPTN